jgi:hypothetical protein
MLKFRASSLAEIMTDGKSGGLSVGAKTHIQQLAKEFVYGYDKRITSKYMDKGIQVEDQSIELLNSVLFTDYKKNTERKENDWITGECDIFTGQMIYDIKSSWSLDTFPVLSSQGEDKTYEWQLRAYMWLWNVDKAAIAYCLVNTPEELVGYENPAIHMVDHINPELRVTFVKYERDKSLEEKIQSKVEAARLYYQEVIEQISKEHS